ncbi:MAG: hypothetical protein ACOZAH_09055 [Pseudomonadota bacterium]
MSWIMTYTGRHFDLLDPRPEHVDILDIAHALANTCRFAGHCLEFYSVAQHSVLSTLLVPRKHALAALMHDAAEAYVGDITRPLKPHLSNYAEIEQGVWAVIAEAFDLPLILPESVKHADRVMLATERRDLLPHDTTPWPCLDGVQPTEAVIRPMSPVIARKAFLVTFNGLMGAYDY